MATTAEIEARREREAEDLVAKIMRLMADSEVETKRRVLTELDRWVSYEESTHAAANRQQH
jgi:hypothetical protein